MPGPQATSRLGAVDRVVVRAPPKSVYGSIAVAVVCVAWDGDDVRELALAVVGYRVNLWLAHIYAGLVPGGWESHTLASVGRWARHEAAPRRDDPQPARLGARCPAAPRRASGRSR